MGDLASRSWLADCFLSQMNRKEVLASVRRWIDSSQKDQAIVAINVSKLVNAQKDPKLADFIQNATINIADGMPVYLATKLTGNPIPERITGVGLMEDLLRMAGECGWRVYFFGSKPEVLDSVLEKVTSEHPGLVVAGSKDGYFEKGTEAEIAQQIGETNPDIVLVALGVPQKEYFVHDHLVSLNASVVLPVGGAFDVYAGTKKRAPDWAQKMGVEWLWRSIYDRSRAGLVRKSFLPFIGIVIKEVYKQRFKGKREKGITRC